MLASSLSALLACAAAAFTLPPGSEDLWRGVTGRVPYVPAVRQAPALGAEAAIVASSGAAVIPESRLLDLLWPADIVYVGEQHDEPLHHLVQRAVLEGLHDRGKRLALGLEMADITQQKTLDDYSSGAMSEAAFAAFWKKAWGVDFSFYRPALSFAKENGIPLVALNAPRAVVSQVAKGGLDSLSAEQRALIPDVEPIRDPRYLAYVRASLGGHGQLPPEREARMLEAMQVWNETMGRSAREAAARHGSLVVIAGYGHMLYGGGVAECVAAHSPLAQAIVLPYPLDGAAQTLRELLRRLQAEGSQDRSMGDYFWLLPRAASGQ